MIYKLITTFLALFFGTVLIITGESPSRAQSQPAYQSFAVSQYGTLLEVFDENGKSRFGKLANNGFELSYEFKGKTISVSAVGDGKAIGLLPGQVKLDGHSATVSATTSEKALEITSYFNLDEKTGKLIVRRKFKNLSAGPLTLKTLREIVDPLLVITDQQQSLSDQELAKLVKDRFQAALPIDDCRTADCPKGPPPCPVPCGWYEVKQAQLSIKTNPLEISFKWLPGVKVESTFGKTPNGKSEVSSFFSVEPAPIGKIGRAERMVPL